LILGRIHVDSVRPGFTAQHRRPIHQHIGVKRILTNEIRWEGYHFRSGDFTTGSAPPCPSGAAVFRLPQKSLGFLASTNVQGGMRVLKMPAKVEWHENRLGFQLRAVRK
jgi:hypothetical protein